MEHFKDSGGPKLNWDCVKWEDDLGSLDVIDGSSQTSYRRDELLEKKRKGQTDGLERSN
jgi:hypothetical protein